MGGILLALIASGTLLAQSYTLRDAVSSALDRYPATKVSTEQMAAAASAINLARTGYLPRLDFSAQANRATHNNVFGMLLPPAGVPGISGPVLGTTGLGSVWGSAVGLQVSWEAFDFGLRGANVGLAEAGRKRAETTVARTRFEVASAAADAFLTLVAAQQTAVAAEAGVRRSKVLRDVVEALAKAQLRPGADLSRARAELAVAETQWIQAQQAIEVAKASLSRFVGGDPAQISTQQGPLLELPPPVEAPASPAAAHPVLAEQNAVILERRASRTVLDKSFYPKFNLTGASYARGTGALPNGTTLGGLSGLGPNIHNWGVALAINFSLFDLPALKARKEIASHQERAETARLQQEQQDLSAALARARAAAEGARRIAGNTPIELQAARDSERQATARYKAGLGTLIEVADAQRLVTQAEIDDSIARLNVWRAMLGVAAAAGDLEPFLTQASR
ncbi:MAG TPA: TolC family protein [Bryobacteraceae bacterium]